MGEIKVKEVYVIIAEGEDSFCSIHTSDGHFPAVCAKKELADLFFEKIRKLSYKPVFMVKFTNPEIVRG